jgi:GT2 family glycosyltransferase
MLSIIIINYKTPVLTERCVRSIYDAELKFSFEVIVVDNDSQDNSEGFVLKEFPDVIWISNIHNAGFGRANNFGAEKATGEFLLFLNSDMLLLKDQKLDDCITMLENDLEIGVLGCKLLNEDGSDQKSTYYDVATIHYLLSFNILWYKLFKPKSKSLDAIMGSFMLMRKKDFIEIGGFDTDFFMYAEELELCARLKKRKKQIVFYENYTATHKHGGSSTGSNWSLKQNLLSNALLHLKLNGVFGYFVYHFIFHLNILTNSLLFFTLDRLNRKSYVNLYRCYFSNYGHYFRIPFYYTLVRNRNFLKVKK